jgi:hypothetical protein
MALSPHGKIRFPSGHMLNLIAVDTSRLMDWFWNPHDLWAGPMLIIANVVLLFVMLGWTAVVALIGVILLFPLNWWIAKVTVKDHVFVCMSKLTY